MSTAEKSKLPKKPYIPPQTKVLGLVRELTLGGGGSGSDMFMPGMAM